LLLGTGGTTIGTLTLKRNAKAGVESLVDDVSIAAPELAKAADSPHRLLYATPELRAPLHLSGTVQVQVKLASSKPAANLSVYLVQLPWADGRIGTDNLITRGWADPQNWRDLHGGDFHSMQHGQPLVPGAFVTFTFDLEPDDQIVPAGKRIGLMILSSDHDFTLWPKPGTELMIDLDGTKVKLPIVGGEAAFAKAVGS
jgi:X-Pro dipeptidyl-peptidase